jgi:transcriptional regulator with XRE-family HTH domain
MPEVDTWTGADARRLRVVALRMSLREFADHLGVPHRTVSKWEQAGAAREPRPHMQAILDTALARAGDDAKARFAQSGKASHPADRPEVVHPATVTLGAGSGPSDQFAPRADPTALWLPASTAQDARDFAVRDFVLDRRQIITGGIAALAVGTRLTEPIDGWAAGIPLYYSASKTQTVTEEEVHHIEMTVRALRKWEGRFRLGIKRKAILGQLAEVAELVEAGQPVELERRLSRVLAELAKVAASMSWEGGLNAEAQHYYLLALRASHAAHDPLFGLNVLASMARQMLYLDRNEDALEIVRAAVDGAPRTTPRVHAMIRVREAWAHARMGRAEAFRRVTGKAEDLMATPGPGDVEHPDWIDGFDDAELSGTIGGRYLELASVTGKSDGYVHAVSYIGDALRLRAPDNLRNRTLDTVNLARARLGTNEPEEAARTALEAMDMARQINSGHADRKLIRFTEESARFSKNHVVRDARDELTEYLRTKRRTQGAA